MPKAFPLEFRRDVVAAGQRAASEALGATLGVPVPVPVVAAQRGKA